jgi:hypothetical protein
VCVCVLFLPVYRSDLWRSSITTEPSINRFNCHIDQSKFASSLPRPKTSRLLVVRTGQTWIRCVGVSSDSGSLQSLQMAGRPACDGDDVPSFLELLGSSASQYNRVCKTNVV